LGKIVRGKVKFGKRFHIADRFVVVMSDFNRDVEVINPFNKAESGLPILLDNRGFVVWILSSTSLRKFVL
jgi:hypothetical protein